MKYFFILLLLLSNSSIDARTQGTSVVQLLKHSEYIVEYRIIEVLEHQIIIDVLETYKGIKHTKLTINKFMDWACASRESNYVVGQSGIMFIVTNTNSHKMEIMGGRNEGDMLYEDNFIYWGGDFVKDKDSGYEYIRRKFQQVDVKSGIVEYLKNQTKLETLQKQNKITTYKTENPFILYVIRIMNGNF